MFKCCSFPGFRHRENMDIVLFKLYSETSQYSLPVLHHKKTATIFSCYNYYHLQKYRFGLAVQDWILHELVRVAWSPFWHFAKPGWPMIPQLPSLIQLIEKNYYSLWNEVLSPNPSPSNIRNNIAMTCRDILMSRHVCRLKSLRASLF